MKNRKKENCFHENGKITTTLAFAFILDITFRTRKKKIQFKICVEGKVFPTFPTPALFCLEFFPHTPKNIAPFTTPHPPPPPKQEWKKLNRKKILAPTPKINNNKRKTKRKTRWKIHKHKNVCIHNIEI